MEQWNEFKEKMDHELSRKPKSTVCLSLLREGYKLDGEGVKKAIGFNAISSVDYIADSDSLALIEFTDLYSQLNDIFTQTKALYDSNFPNKDTRKQSKKIRGTAQKELTGKYEGTRLIIEEMQKSNFCLALKTQHQNNTALKKYWIIIAPFHPSIKDENKVELARVLVKLQDDITTYFPKAWNIRVNIISIDDFVRPKPR